VEDAGGLAAAAGMNQEVSDGVPPRRGTRVTLSAKKDVL
jgi:hypothetical protein